MLSNPIDASVATLFTDDEGARDRPGVCPAQWFRKARSAGIIRSAGDIRDDQIQPASIDLRLGDRAYPVTASFLPGEHKTVEECVGKYGSEAISLKDGAVLQRNTVYLVPLQESLRLRKRMSATANPKSSTGRLDIFARVITDQATTFDTVVEQYAGPLWVELAPRSFNVRVREGSRLVQLRVRQGSERPSEARMRKLHNEAKVVHSDLTPAIERKGIGIRVDLSGDPISKIIGYRAKDTESIIDVDLPNAYDPRDFWEVLIRPDEGGYVLSPDRFHILVSKESISIPDDLAADMIAYDTLVGEFRVHYAGFFDPGFGYSADKQHAARAVLEVRSHEVPFMIEDGQLVGWLSFEKLSERTDRPYGGSIGSSYQFQGLALSKHFTRS